MAVTVVDGQEIIQQQAQNPGLGIIDMIISFIMHSWGWLFFGAVLLGLGFAVYYLLKGMEELYKERDEPGYQDYKQKMTACLTNADPNKIQKRYSLKNLLWFGIPFIMKENSARIVDWNGRLIMYYRGEIRTSDGYQVFLGYKHKSWVFFEDRFMLKYPMRVRYITNTDEITNDKFTTVKGKKVPIKPIYEEIECSEKKGYLKYLPNYENWRNLRLRSVGIEKFALWWFTPVFFNENQFESLDWRKILEGSVVDNTFQVMNQRNLQISAVATEEMSKINPSLTYATKAPQKTANEEKDDVSGA